MSAQGQGQLARILRSGDLLLADVSPQAIGVYLQALREMSVDRRIQAAVRHTKAALVQAARELPVEAPGIPTVEALKAMARGRYRMRELPGSLESWAPHYLEPLDECEVAKLASAVGLALDATGLRWCQAGSLARCASAEPRPIEGLEFLVEHDEAKVPELVKHLGESFWTSPAALRAAAAERGSAEIYRLPFLMRVVLRDARASPLAESALARRVRAEGSSCGRTWLATAEDSLLEALVAWREAEDGEEVHWRDAAMLLAVQGAGLEAEYVQAWAQRLELCDILREAQAQAGVGCALT